MKRRTTARLIVAAAFVGLPLLAGSAFGQIRVNNGHANDANTRIGSAGYNDNPVAPGNAAVNNAVVTGNVTGLFGFQGANFHGVNLGAGYTDPFAFRGLLAGQGVDQFIAASAGVPTMANPTASSGSFAQGPSPFYGQASTVGGPPQGYVRQPDTGGYVPAPETTTTNPEDLRLGAQDLGVPLNNGLPKAGEVLLPGQVDPTSTTSSVFAASPIFGVRQWQLGDQGQNNMFTPDNGQQQFGPTGPVQRAQQQQLQDLRQELQQENSQTDQDQNNSDQNSNNPNNSNNSSNNSGAIYQGTGATYQGTGAARLQSLKPGDNPNNGQALTPLQNGNSQQVASANLSSTPGAVSTMQSNRQYLDLNLPAPAVQSTQYALLRQRLDQYNSSHPTSDEEASREFSAIIQARRALVAESAQQAQLSKPAVPPGQTPPLPGSTDETANPMGDNAATPPTGAVPSSVFPTGSVPAPVQAPLQVGSLSTGVKAKSLAEMLRHGEDLIKDQQYDQAISVFDSAASAVPNNPMILIGRAEAELGGSYYRQAEVDLRTAFRQDKAVLMGQYDLANTLGDKRLLYVENELKQISEDSPEGETPAFLLAFITYNTHHEDEAATWLATAQKRAGGNDPTLLTLKRYWNLKASAPAQPSGK